MRATIGRFLEALETRETPQATTAAGGQVLAGDGGSQAGQTATTDAGGSSQNQGATTGAATNGTGTGPNGDSGAFQGTTNGDSGDSGDSGATSEDNGSQSVGGNSGSGGSAGQGALPTAELGQSLAGLAAFGAGSRNPAFAIGADTGGGPRVKLFNAAGQVLFDFYAFEPTFTGGTRVAVADFTGDGVNDLAVGAGVGGGPRIRVFDGRNLAEVGNFFAFEPQVRDGVFLGAGDVTGDGKADLVVGAGPGGAPRVVVFDGGTGPMVRSFYGADANLRGGAYVAAGDLNGDRVADIVVAPGRYNPPYVNYFDGRTGALLRASEGFNGFDNLSDAEQALGRTLGSGDRDIIEGIYLASVGDVDGDGRPDVPAGRVFNAPDVRLLGPGVDDDDAEDDQFQAFDDDNDDDGGRRYLGARPIARDLNGDGRAELIVGAGPGSSEVVIYAGGGDRDEPGRELARFEAFPGFLGGVTTG